MKINNNEISIMIKRLTRNLAIATIIAWIVSLLVSLFDEKRNQRRYR